MSNNEGGLIIKEDKYGSKKFTWLSKIVFLIFLIIAGGVMAQYLPEVKQQKQEKKEIGTQAATDYLVEPLFDNEYKKMLLRLLKKSEKSIFVGMYIIDSPKLYKDDYPDWKTDHVYKLLKNLVKAKKRGVDIQVVMSRPLKGQSKKRRAHVATKNWLKEEGIEARFNQSSVHLHDKVVIIDEKWILQGSHNWTNGALVSNYESSLLLEVLGDKKVTWSKYRNKLEEGRLR
jgi:phosphatidylserine/phosphatidylglycerophosphate/cardiolipin synthase-like enzyme